MTTVERFQMAVAAMPASTVQPLPEHAELVGVLRDDPRILFDERTGIAILLEQAQAMSINDMRAAFEPVSDQSRYSE